METLIRKVMMPDGAVRSEHRITCITSRIGHDTVIDVESTGDGVDDYITKLIVSPYEGLLTEEQAFDILENSPSFVEWDDPVQDAIDTLLPILTDEQAEAVTSMYPEWSAGTDYSVGARVQYGGKLYRCVQAHTSQEGWEPPATPALWVRTAHEEIPVWVQPTGAQDAYNTGDKVHYQSATDPVYVSLIDGNVWSPADYPQGWQLVSDGGE